MFSLLLFRSFQVAYGGATRYYKKEEKKVKNKQTCISSMAFHFNLFEWELVPSLRSHVRNVPFSKVFFAFSWGHDDYNKGSAGDGKRGSVVLWDAFSPAVV